MPYDITYMWDFKSDTNKLILKIETDSQAVYIYIYIHTHTHSERHILKSWLT